MTPPTGCTVLLVSDFNTQNLSALLANSHEPPPVQVREAPFGQVEQILRDGRHAAWSPGPDLALVWTRPQAVLPTFGRALRFEQVEPDAVLAEVEAFADALMGLRDRAETILVPSWTAPRERRGLGPIDLTHPLGSRRLVLEANVRLLEALDGVPGIHVLDAEDWLPKGKTFNDRLWYLAKIPYDNDVFRAAAAEVKATIRALAGASRKLVVVDLDDTLWGGIVGDEGWENLKLGGHDADGEAYAEFQRALESLANRGILLAIASKNEEATALEAIDRHPEMVLSRHDFAAWRINWGDKARSVSEIARELNLGLQSVVFIDDSPAERARVRETLPEVLVPEWPSAAWQYAHALRSMTCFDTVALTGEDRARTQTYRQERERRAAQAEVGSIGEWLESLGTEVRVERLSPVNLARAAQLFNKTNQMNLATRRMSEAELEGWAAESDHEFYTFRVSDRFGEYGLTGLLGMVIDGAELRVADFVLSCRVMSRNVEETMLAWTAARARARGCSRIVAHHLPTPKNGPCLEFFTRSGLEPGSEIGSFVWDLASPFPIPAGVVLEGETPAAAGA